ncbi:NERD domain-containing protein [Bacillus cytotoxicus]|uniref:NERD domain-containing protein n=1 Tax=Bacillus cereus group sp. BfR-BA-01492 TaxID=2920361 RepID=UPI001F5A675F|nr:NERD domain-containing protein [Bacillus cereus group sp. BfR-BA-01492]EMA6345098.1 NERD domain-containing protein [Bacillus cytotoxicus]
MEYVLICVILALLAVAFVLFYKNKQLESEKQQVDFEKAQVIENYQGEIAATVENYEQQQEMIKNIEKQKYNDLKVKTAREIENMRMMKNELTMQHSKERSEMQQKHNHEVQMLQNFIADLKAYSKNVAEIHTHELLHNMKQQFIQQEIVKENEIYMIPNIFLPKISSRTKRKMENRRIHHVLLLRTGVYVIETVECKGRIIHGLTKDNAGIFSFIVDEIGKYQYEHNQEETFIFIKEEQMGTLKVVNEGNVVYKIQHLSESLYEYLKEKNAEIVKEKVKPVVYFENERKEHEIIDCSHERVPRLKDREQFIMYFKNVLLNEKVLYTAKELQEIKNVMEQMDKAIAQK